MRIGEHRGLERAIDIMATLCGLIVLALIGYLIWRVGGTLNQF